MGLAIIWHEHCGPVNDADHGRRGRLPRPAYEDHADPGAEAYDPRPEWYFFFLFQLLRIFKKPQLLLFAHDHHPDDLDGAADRAGRSSTAGRERRVSRRPVAMVLGVAIPIAAAVPDAGRARRRRPGRRRLGAPRCRGFANVAAVRPCHTLADAGTGPARSARTSTAPSPTTRPRSSSSRTARAACPRSRASSTDDQIKCIAGYVVDRRRRDDGKPTCGRGDRRACSRRQTSPARRLSRPVTDSAGPRPPACTCREATPACASSSASPAPPARPYAARVLDGLAAPGAEVGLCVSAAPAPGDRVGALPRPRAARRAEAIGAVRRRPRRRRHDAVRRARLVLAVRLGLGALRRAT